MVTASAASAPPPSAPASAQAVSARTYPPMVDLVPHGAPMLVVEEMVDWAPGRARCRMTVRRGQPLVGPDGVGTVMAMEYMAQALAACLGHEAFLEGEGVRVGMIIACRSMTLDVPRIPVGAELDIVVERIRGNDMLSHFDGVVRAEGQRLAKATLTVFHAEKPPEA